MESDIVSQAPSLVVSLQRGWNRMVSVLFRPFDLGRWLVLAFSAWLAGLAGGGGGGGSSASWRPGGIDGRHWGDGDAARDAVERGWRWLTEDVLALSLIVFALLFALALLIALLWVSSRAKFVYLDNALHGRAEIVAPWKRFAPLGDSLFTFRVILTLITLPLVLGSVFTAIGLGLGIGWLGGADGPAVALGIVAAISLLVVVAVTAAYIAFFTDAYVVPIMHRFEVRVVEGWRRFGEVFARRRGSFLLSGLFVVMLALVLGVGVVAVGLMTCCIGFILLAIPYLGTVILLPLLLTYRLFTVDYLESIEGDLGALDAPAAG